MHELIEKIEEIANTVHFSTARRMDYLLNIGIQATSASIGAVGQVHANRYRIFRQQGEHEHYATGKVYPVRETYARLVMSNNGLLAIPNIKRSIYRASECFKLFRLEAYIGVPLIVRGKPFGVLEFGSQTAREGDFSDLALSLMYMMGSSISQLIEADIARQSDRTTGSLRLPRATGELSLPEDRMRQIGE